MGSDLIAFPPNTQDAELAAARANIAGMEAELRLAIGADATKSWQSALSIVRGLVPLRKTLDQISTVLRCHDTNPPVIMDAVTRLVEENSRLTSETSSALAVERKAHQETKAKLDRVRDEVTAEVRGAIEAGSGGRFAPTVGAIKQGNFGIILELAASWFNRGQLIETLERRLDGIDEDDDAKCAACGAARCESCDGCHECDPDDGSCSEQSGGDANGDADENEDVLSPLIIAAIESMTSAMATSGRDWRSSPLDAWLYGVIVGWQDDDLQAVAKAHGWPDEVVTRIRDLHNGVIAVSGYGGDQ